MRIVLGDTDEGAFVSIDEDSVGIGGIATEAHALAHQWSDLAGDLEDVIKANATLGHRDGEVLVGVDTGYGPHGPFYG